MAANGLISKNSSYRNNCDRVIRTHRGDKLVCAAPSGKIRITSIIERNEHQRKDSGDLTLSCATPLVTRQPLKPALDRNDIAKQCVLMAAQTHDALLDAHELDAEMKDMTIWLQAHTLPSKWRRQLLIHLDTIHCQMRFCREQLLHGWKLIHPPFHQPSLDLFDRRLRLFEQSVQLLAAAIKECKSKMLNAEALAACRFIQLWTRQLLAKRGFYTKVINLSFHHRGIVAGMFDSIKGTSKLTTHGRNQNITLEYPRSDNNWDSLNK